MQKAELTKSLDEDNRKLEATTNALITKLSNKHDVVFAPSLEEGRVVFTPMVESDEEEEVETSEEESTEEAEEEGEEKEEEEGDESES